METELINQAIAEFARKKAKVLIISCEGKYTFSSIGSIITFDEEYIQLQTETSVELIKISNVIKIKSLKNGC